MKKINILKIRKIINSAIIKWVFCLLLQSEAYIHHPVLHLNFSYRHFDNETKKKVTLSKPEMIKMQIATAVKGAKQSFGSGLRLIGSGSVSWKMKKNGYGSFFLLLLVYCENYR